MSASSKSPCYLTLGSNSEHAPGHSSFSTAVNMSSDDLQTLKKGFVGMAN